MSNIESQVSKGEKILAKMIEGYGPKLPPLGKLFTMQPSADYLLRLNSPYPALGRYYRYTKFLEKVTSQKAVALLRFHVMKEYFIALSEQMDQYDGKFRHKKIVGHLTSEDIDLIRQIGTTLQEIYWAELFEAVSDHDTAAAGDYLKTRIAYLISGMTEWLSNLIDYIEGIHFPNTSEDVMSNVFGVIGNELVYGHFMTKLLDYLDFLIKYVERYEYTGFLLLPELTHIQPAEPTTLAGKFITRLVAIKDLLFSLRGHNGKYMLFSGKLNGATGGFITHYAAYPDINWPEFTKGFVEKLGLHYERWTDQCVPFSREAQIFTTIGNILTEVIKLTRDFILMASAPAQFFIKVKVAGEKGSSVLPNKFNAWKLEGAVAALLETQWMMTFMAHTLPSYPHAGDMARSYLMRNLGMYFTGAFIGLGRIMEEMEKYVPNPAKIRSFLNEYPGMAGSSIQSILKREGIADDAYRTIQTISINPDGSYANAAQFRAGLETKMSELGLPEELREELRIKLDFRELVRPTQDDLMDEIDGLKFELVYFRRMSDEIRQNSLLERLCDQAG